MVQCIFYQMDKRQNSTARPNAGTNQIRKQGQIKQPFDVINPEISIIADKTGLLKNPVNVNYVKIGEPLNRYYFISNWEYDRGIYTANCTLDALATYKDSIRDTTQYINRCSTRFNVGIADTVYPILPQTYIEQTYSAYGRSTPYKPNILDGTFIIGVSNDQQTNKFGTSQYYMLDYSAMLFLTQQLFGSVDWLNVDDISNNLLKTLFNPFQYFNTCYWLPFDFDDIRPQKDYETDIHFGYWSRNWPNPQHTRCIALDPITVGDGRVTYDIIYNIPKHPQYNRGKCYGSSQYNNYTLWLEPFGLIDIDADIIGTHQYLNVQINIDVFSRKAIITLFYNDGATGTLHQFGQQYYDNFGIDIPIGSVTLNSSDTKTYGMMQATAIASNKANEIVQNAGIANNRFSLFGSNVNMSYGDLATGIGTSANILASNGATLATSGGTGSILIYDRETVLLHKYRMVADENLEELGRPLMARLSLDSLDGYVQISDPDVWSIPATYQQKQLVKNYMISGFHIQ